jgi:hypothetical protein
MVSHLRVWMASALLALLASCGPYAVNYTPLAPPSPSPAPSATPGPLSAAPGTLTFNSTGLTQPVVVTDPGFSGTYVVSGCAGIANFGAVTNGTLNVTSAAAGSCTLTISDTFSHSATVSVGVTALNVPVI